MLCQMVSIEGTCAICASAVRIEVIPGRIELANPSDVVVIARQSGPEPAHEVYCPFTLFACSTAPGIAFTTQVPECQIVSLADALPHAEAIFGKFCGESLPARRQRSGLTMARLHT